MALSSVRAMVLAAGRGERMRPLTDACPKPLLPVHGKPLMQWSLEALARGGFSSVVVNTAWLGESIEKSFGSFFDGAAHLADAGLVAQTARQTHIVYSHEGRDFGAALETAGGIARALPLLCPTQANGSVTDESDGKVFWVVAGDVFAPDFVFSLEAVARFVASGKLAHLWLVPNPAHHVRGDFGLQLPVQNLSQGGAGVAASSVGLALNLPPESAEVRYTYSTIGLYHRALFAPPWCDIPPGNPRGERAALGPLLRAAMEQQQVSAELYAGAWTDVGTPQRLAQLNA